MWCGGHAGCALHEKLRKRTVGPCRGAFGDFLNHNLADYHVATNADVGELDVAFVDDPDDQLNPSGVKGLGEIGIVGVPAAIANAVWHATGVRHRELPVTPASIISGQ